MTIKKSYEEINQKIREGKAVVVTAEEVIGIVKEKGMKEATKEVDVVTTATFGPMCSTGAFLNFGHSDPPIRMTRVSLNNVSAYAGIAAVDAFIGATEVSEDKGMEYGGAHVIVDLIDGKEVLLKASSYGTDCYPKTEIETYINKDSINQAYLYNPRNAYQNYAAAVNGSEHVIHTYMGILQPRMGNVTYCSAGELSPLLNDPYYRTIGIGSRIFLAGAVGYVSWEGTQHNPSKARGENGIPMSNAGTLAVVANLKEMSSRFIRPAVFEKYGVSMFVGIGVPIPILDEEMMEHVSVQNKDIYTDVIDYSVPKRNKPSYGRVSYEELRSGMIEINGKKIRTSPLSSLSKAREIADLLKEWIKEGKFYVEKPVQHLPMEARPNSLEANMKED